MKKNVLSNVLFCYIILLHFIFTLVLHTIPRHTSTFPFAIRKAEGKVDMFLNIVPIEHAVV